MPVIVGTLAVAVLGSPLLYFLTFDFDPIHLRSAATESISTLLELGGDPRVGINSANIVTPSLDDASAAAEKLRKATAGVGGRDACLALCRRIRIKNWLSFEDLGHRLGQTLQQPAFEQTTNRCRKYRGFERHGRSAQQNRRKCTRAGSRIGEAIGRRRGEIGPGR